MNADCCFTCDQPFEDGQSKAVAGSDGVFHVACFVCCECKEDLSEQGYVKKEDQFYCVSDYSKKFGERCAQCSEIVEGSHIKGK